MGNDFKSYAKNSKNMSSEDMKKIKQKFSDGDIKKAENFTKKYENMSENQLLSEIQKMAGNGVSEKELNAFVQNISPMLDSSQREKLKTVINMLKR